LDATLTPTSLPCAETKHATVRLLAGQLPTIGPKRNSEALGSGFRSVADAGLVAVLPLSLSGTPKQQCARDLNQLATWPLVVETRAMRSARRVR
jgi:hypothetical protein